MMRNFNVNNNVERKKERKKESKEGIRGGFFFCSAAFAAFVERDKELNVVEVENGKKKRIRV